MEREINVKCAVLGCEAIVAPTTQNLVQFTDGNLHPVCERCLEEIEAVRENDRRKWEETPPMRRQARAMLYTQAKRIETARMLAHPRTWFTKRYGILFPNCRYGWQRMMRLTPHGGVDAAREQRRAGKHATIALSLLAAYVLIGWVMGTLRWDDDIPQIPATIDLAVLCVVLGYGIWASAKLQRYTSSLNPGLTRKEENEDNATMERETNYEPNTRGFRRDKPGSTG